MKHARFLRLLIVRDGCLLRRRMTDDSLQGYVIVAVLHVVADAVERLETVVGKAERPLGRGAVGARHKGETGSVKNGRI